MSALIVKGGTVVTATGSVRADVVIEGEKVAAVVAPDSSQFSNANPKSEIDATGKLVIPGGVDVHTHMEMPFGGTVSSETFATGTAAAAWGGTTTIVDFAIQPRGASQRQGLETWMERADGHCAIDYGFHMILSEVTSQSLKEMSALVHDGVTSFKLFMAYPGVFYSDDGQILQAMFEASDCGATIMMHAENGIAIDVLAARALARGKSDPEMHGQTRPSALEGEATHRAIVLASVAGCPLYIVHLSAAEALSEVAAAKDAGQPVFAETCPQYLFLDDSLLASAGFEGAKYVCSPPIRELHHQAELWKGLGSGDLSAVATDHCPFCFKEQKELGRGDFTKIPNGLPGVEHRIDLVYQGVVSGLITQERWVELISTSPARLFGLYPQKGSLLPGSDADLVVYDPDRAHTLGVSSHHMSVDYSAYEGLTVSGGVDVVVSRGEILVKDGEYHGGEGRGHFIPRQPFTGLDLPIGQPS